VTETGRWHLLHTNNVLGIAIPPLVSSCTLAHPPLARLLSANDAQHRWPVSYNPHFNSFHDNLSPATRATRPLYCSFSTGQETTDHAQLLYTRYTKLPRSTLKRQTRSDTLRLKPETPCLW